MEHDAPPVQQAPVTHGTGLHTLEKPCHAAPQLHVAPPLGGSEHAPVTASQQTPLHGPSAHTAPLRYRQLGSVQPADVVTVHVPAEVQHAPPHGLVGAHAAKAP